DRLLVTHEPEEAFDVAPAQLLVGAREPRQLADVGVAPAPVPLGEPGRGVVVLDQDLLAQALERHPGRDLHKPRVPLLEGEQEPLVLLAKALRKGALESGVERAPPRRAPEER